MVDWQDRIVDKGFSFDDLLLVPALCEILPNEVDIKTSICGFEFKIPYFSAAMDTITESSMAIAMGINGGGGVIHRNCTIEYQKEQVAAVKRHRNWIITSPLTCLDTDPIAEAEKLMKDNNISGLPVLNNNGKLAGIVTSRDMRGTRLSLVRDIMTHKNLITTNIAVSSKKAAELMMKHRVEKLLVVDGDRLDGLITYKDIENRSEYPNASIDGNGQLIALAAIGVGNDHIERLEALIKAGVDIVVIDTAHAHSKMCLEFTKNMCNKYPIQFIVGNIATAEAVHAYADVGVSAVKIGIGPGSICTTRIVSGAGMPQMTAIFNCVQEAQKWPNLDIIADGGIKFYGDVAKAIAAGANGVMIGNGFSGTLETPGKIFKWNGQRFKGYRGMGSDAAMAAGSDRYNNLSSGKITPEGVEARVPFKGQLEEVLIQWIGGLRSGMGYTGCRNLAELQTKTEFTEMTHAAFIESQPHGVEIIQS
jgi:IMP dehydrogenase